MKKFIIFILIILVAGCSLGYYHLFSNNIKNEYILILEKAEPAVHVIDKLVSQGVFRDDHSILIISNLLNIKQIPAGYYKLKPSMGTYRIITKLKNGQQDPVKVTLSSATFISDIAGKISKKMKFDSLDFLQFILADSNLSKYHASSDEALCLFLPNTHEFYWNQSPQKVFHKFHKDHQNFWSPERKLKASKLGLTQNEVYILASLVQKEYYKKEERSKIAGVLVNRIKNKMPLQVDATCKYATRDFTAKRVLHFHTQYPSPYNTYIHQGIPPGPICMPERETIDAILDYEQHDFLFYCADPSLNGYHIFSKILAEHESVAKTYHQKMNELKMK